MGTGRMRQVNTELRTLMPCLRFIPNRQGEDFFSSFHLLNDESSSATPSKSKKRPPHGDLHFQRSKRGTLVIRADLSQLT